MSFVSSLIAAFVTLTMSGHALAQDIAGEDFAGVDGHVRLQGRVVDDPVKAADYSSRGQIRVDGWVDLTRDGCLKLRARLSTGEVYNNEWFDTGLGANHSNNLKLSARHLYVDAKCLSEKVRVELGALPVRNAGSLGLTNSGWIDGLRITVRDEEKKREWAFSISNLATRESSNVFERKITGINHAQVEMKQTFQSSSVIDSVNSSISVFDETLFTRIGLDFAVKKYVTWLKKAGFEMLTANDHLLGGLISTNFDLAKWDTRIFVARLKADPSSREKNGLLLKQFYGLGDNLYVEANRKISDSSTANLRGRVGKAGLLAEAGITVRFSKNFAR